MRLTTPGPTVGVVGGGQLGRMLGEAAAPLGVDLVVLDPTPDAPAARVADQIEGDFDDEAALRELAERADVLTWEIELADPDALGRVADELGVQVHPRPRTLSLIEDKLVQKRGLAKAGVPVPQFRRVDAADELRAALDELGEPAMLKARTGGYDGRGNVPVRGPGEAEAALDAVGGDAMVEAFVDYDRELSVIACQGDGEVDAFPVTETIHEEEILRQTVTPARTRPEVRERALDVARDVLDVMEGRGVYGIELFEDDGEVLLNEIAPRPHNSGHWTIEGARASQFEQHARAVLGWPLGDTGPRGTTAIANLLGDVDEEQPAGLAGVEAVLEHDRANLHWYGKRQARPLRKMGHVTVAGDEGENPDAVLDAAGALAEQVTFREG